ncbi:MAG: LysR family transcriptional regulator [Burkholderiaceae bacterium]
MNIKDIDLNLLLVFEVVYSERNLSRSAKTIGISQSAISNALGRLRDTLGEPLFVRSGQGVVPTTYAESIAPDVSRALSILRGALLEATFNYRLSNRRFTLICSDYSASVILPAVLRKVQEEAPLVTLNVIAKHDGSDFAPALAQGEADLAIGGLPFLTGSIRHQRLFDEEIVVLTRRGHPALKSRPNMLLLNRYPHVLVNPYGNWLPWEHLAERTGVAVDPHIAIRVPTYLAALYLLESGDFLSSCPQRLAALLMRHFPMEILKLPASLATMPIGQYWHERSQADPGHQWLRQLVHDVCMAL